MQHKVIFYNKTWASKKLLSLSVYVLPLFESEKRNKEKTIIQKIMV
ncbi:hypothetical protein X560_2202 [Listeria fleischmannii 1991]|uniref:Uncharacterized protein n=1 Tax=Listeria fleischmannii 1991 TaxID=1430899 RepID=A0A0J8J217_9LIST|nr:hypothetical protein X560_2202 [Listeria fleischmannii 1991]